MTIHHPSVKLGATERRALEAIGCTQIPEYAEDWGSGHHLCRLRFLGFEVAVEIKCRVEGARIWLHLDSPGDVIAVGVVRSTGSVAMFRYAMRDTDNPALNSQAIIPPGFVGDYNGQ